MKVTYFAHGYGGWGMSSKNMREAVKFAKSGAWTHKHTRRLGMDDFTVELYFCGSDEIKVYADGIVERPQDTQRLTIWEAKKRS